MNRKTIKKPAKKSNSSPVSRAVRLLKGAFASEPDAITLLEEQHKEVKALFKRIEKGSTRAVKVKAFDELAANLCAHDAIEREIFYPACEKAMGLSDLLGEALVEHGFVEFGLYQCDQARADKDFAFKCKVLSEVVEHHVKEEEEEFFPKARRALGKEKLAELGARMKARFEEAKSEDYHPPLYENLKQVMAGVLKPVKRRKAA